MKLDGVHSPILPVQNRRTTQAQEIPEPPEIESEVTTQEEGGGEAGGVISKLNEGDHFNAVADIRLRIAHFDNPDLLTVEPEASEDADVSGKAYEKFLERYGALYAASQTPLEPLAAAVAEPLPETEGPAIENLVPEPAPVIEEPVAEAPPVSEEPAVTEGPVEESEGILPAFEGLQDIQPLEENPEILDIIM
jgi:hypothetical protein